MPGTSSEEFGPWNTVNATHILMIIVADVWVQVPGMVLEFVTFVYLGYFFQDLEYVIVINSFNMGKT